HHDRAAGGSAGSPECPASVPADYRGRRAAGVAVPHRHGAASTRPQRRAGAPSVRSPERLGAGVATVASRSYALRGGQGGAAAATVLGGIAAEVGRPLAATMSELEAA